MPTFLRDSGTVLSAFHHLPHTRAISLPLSAYLAGMPIRLDEKVMRCMLASPHPYNIRGLFEIVSKARRRQGSSIGQQEESVLRIELEDLDERFQNGFNELHKAIIGAAPGKNMMRVFEFRLYGPVYSTALQDIFEEGARILSSISVKNPGKTG